MVRIEEFRSGLLQIRGQGAADGRRLGQSVLVCRSEAIWWIDGDTVGAQWATPQKVAQTSLVAALPGECRGLFAQEPRSRSAGNGMTEYSPGWPQNVRQTASHGLIRASSGACEAGGSHNTPSCLRACPAPGVARGALCALRTPLSRFPLPRSGAEGSLGGARGILSP